MFRPLIAALALGALLPAARVGAQNLLANPGFETGSFAGWTLSGNAPNVGVAADGTSIAGVDPRYAPAFVNARVGAFAAFGVVRTTGAADAGTEFFTLAQSLAVQPHQSYDVGFFLGNDSREAFGLLLALDRDVRSGLQQYVGIYVDGFNVLDEIPTVRPGGDAAAFTQLGGRFNAGARASVSVAFRITAGGSARVGASADDFYVSAVPEPSAVVLTAAGLGALAMTAARRRVRPA